jgi:hypothetical protein
VGQDRLCAVCGFAVWIMRYGAIEQSGYGTNLPHYSGLAYNLFQQDKPYIIPTLTVRKERQAFGGYYLSDENDARVLDRFSIDMGFIPDNY